MTQIIRKLFRCAGCDGEYFDKSIEPNGVYEYYHRCPDAKAEPFGPAIPNPEKPILKPDGTPEVDLQGRPLFKLMRMSRPMPIAKVDQRDERIVVEKDANGNTVMVQVDANTWRAKKHIRAEGKGRTLVSEEVVEVS